MSDSTVCQDGYSGSLCEVSDSTVCPDGYSGSLCEVSDSTVCQDVPAPARDDHRTDETHVPVGPVVSIRSPHPRTNNTSATSSGPACNVEKTAA